ncbi:MAG: DNA polymerase Y family protein [Hyphomicrobiales bacterium]|nr:DNA polymerase Y family protein [Hyphomicrobiales bacterium]
MRRWVCVWLPRFRTDRLERRRRETEAPHDQPLAIIAPGKGGNRLVAVNAAAARVGLRAGILLTDATAIEPGLKALPQDGPGETAELKRLALWLRRYSPHVAPDGDDGLWIDITGAAHLFGGEQALLRDIARRFHRAGLACRAAVASTHAAAWGLARFAAAPLSVVAIGEDRDALSPLPVRALNIAEDKAALLDRLGLKTVGQLVSMPRSALRSRFGETVCERLEQALGLAGEGLTSLGYEPVYGGRIDFAEPVTTLDAIEQVTQRLIEQTAAQLVGDGKGARRFTLTVFDTQGGSVDVNLALARASHDPAHIARVFKERFTALEGRFDETLGFDAAALRARRVEVIKPQQSDLTDGGDRGANDKHALTALFDRLSARLGKGAVTRFAFPQSHMPERASITVSALQKAPPPVRPITGPRPFLLLPRAELVTVMAELPDYPPRRFTWRRVHHRVVKAEGPERIEAEWWRAREDDAPPRDYYRVEDDGGRRFWLYREGFYAAGNDPPRWFMHGLFA